MSIKPLLWVYTFWVLEIVRDQMKSNKLVFPVGIWLDREEAGGDKMTLPGAESREWRPERDTGAALEGMLCEAS